MKLTKENWDKADKITYCIFKHGVLIYVGKRETFSYLGGEGCDFFPASEIKMPGCERGYKRKYYDLVMEIIAPPIFGKSECSFLIEQNEENNRGEVWIATVRLWMYKEDGTKILLSKAKVVNSESISDIDLCFEMCYRKIFVDITICGLYNLENGFSNKMPDAGDDVIDMVRIGSGFALCHRSGGMSNPTELQTRIFNFGKQFTAVEESKMPEGAKTSPLTPLGESVANLAEIVQGQIVAVDKLRRDVGGLMKKEKGKYVTQGYIFRGTVYDTPEEAQDAWGEYLKTGPLKNWIEKCASIKPETDARDFTRLGYVTGTKTGDEQLIENSIYNKPERPEKILCAAVQYQVLSSKDVKCQTVLGIDYDSICQPITFMGMEGVRATKGFLTTRNRFVTNPEAWNIARKANQIGDKYFEDFIAVLEPKDLL